MAVSESYKIPAVQRGGYGQLLGGMRLLTMNNRRIKCTQPYQPKMQEAEAGLP